MDANLGAFKKKDLGLIRIIVACAGCCLGEVSRARKDDVVLDHAIPHLVNRTNEMRGIKTRSFRQHPYTFMMHCREAVVFVTSSEWFRHPF